MKRVLLRNRQYHHRRSNPDLVTSNAGFVISEDNLILGVSPDDCAYDPSTLEAFGLVEVKCPNKHCGYAPTKACLNADFFCELVAHSSGDQIFQSKKPIEQAVTMTKKKVKLCSRN